MPEPYSEAKTRQEIIDGRLELAGWSLSDPSQVTEELDIDLSEGMPKAVKEDARHEFEGHQFVDYALKVRGKPAVVVEAKKTSKDAQLGQEQALRYANNLRKLNGDPLPFITYTNGYDTFFWDSEFYPPVKVYGFPTTDDVEWMLERQEGRKPLSTEMINTDIAGRDYQIEAIRTLLEKIEEKKRHFLLTMATGTGKTRTAVALAELLIRARWVKRVLFLVDRIPLRDQALNAFAEHMPGTPRWPEKDVPFSKDRRVYVATYPAMLNLIHGGRTTATHISPFFFDLIIADESHRSIYNVYKEVVDYFHGFKLGLTATPRDHVEHDTFKLFDCPVNDPTFAYSYEEAINHNPPYLSDFEVLKVRSKFQLEGIKGKTLSPEQQEQLIQAGHDPEDINFEGTDLEKKVTNAPTNGIIVREFMEESIKDPSGTLPGKSIIFAMSIGHARRLEELFNELYPEHRGRLARVMVSEDRFVYGKGGLLDQFKNKDMPRVAISVDMLDTGVDVLEAVNLVFAKPVFSYVKFWQMIGRGTRILDDDPEKRRPWCVEKDKFLIIDCWGNFEHFEMKPKGREPGAQVALPVRLFRARLDKLEAALAKGEEDIEEAVKEELRQELTGLPANSVTVQDKKADLAAAERDDFWRDLDAKNIGFLRTAIAPVMRASVGRDVKGLRFELDVVELGTARLLENVQAVEILRDSIVGQVQELPLSVNVVANEEELIRRVQEDVWWRDVADESLRDLASRLAPLMKYRQTRRGDILKLNLDDLLTIKETIEFGPDRERVSLSAYRQRVEATVRELVSESRALQALQAGEEIGEEQLHLLAQELRSRDPYVTEELLQKIYDNRTAGFRDFMRHILGLEQIESWLVSVTRAFDEFLAEHNNLSALQIRFILTVRTFILQNRALKKADLVEAPFTRLDPRGIRGLFTEAEIQEILDLSEKLVA